MEGPWASFNSVAVIQGVSSPWPLITFAVNKHMSTLALARRARAIKEGSNEIAADVAAFRFLSEFEENRCSPHEHI